MYRLGPKEKLVDAKGAEVPGPGIVRVHDFDGHPDLHSLQINTPNGEFRLEVDGNIDDFVQEISPPPKTSPKPGP